MSLAYDRIKADRARSQADLQQATEQFTAQRPGESTDAYLARLRFMSSGTVPGTGGIQVDPRAVSRAISAATPRQPSLADQFQSAQDDAKKQNEQRYGQILTGFDDMLKRLEGSGQQESADIRQQFQGLQASAGQDLVSRGLGNTTIAPQIQAGIGRQEAGAQGSLQDRLRQQELGIRERKLGAIERRDDVGPDFGLLAQLYQGQGAAAVQPQFVSSGSGGPLTAPPRPSGPRLTFPPPYGSPKPRQQVFSTPQAPMQMSGAVSSQDPLQSLLELYDLG